MMTTLFDPGSARLARRRRALILAVTALLLFQIVIGIAALVTLSCLPRAETGLLGAAGFLRDLPTLRREGGYRLHAVPPGSPAAAAGLAPGDLLTELDGIEVAAAPAAAMRALRWSEPGRPLSLSWRRQGQASSTELAPRPAGPHGPSPLHTWLLYGPLLLPPFLLLLVGALVGLLRPLDARAWSVSLAFLSLAQSVSLLLDQAPLLGVLPLPILVALFAFARLALYPLAFFSLAMLSHFPSESRLGRWLGPWRWIVTLPFAALALDGLLDSFVLAGAAARPLGALGALLQHYARWELLIVLLVALCAGLLAAQRSGATASAQRRRGIIEVGILGACVGALWAVLVWKTGWHQNLAAGPGEISPLWLLSWLLPMVLFSLLPASFAYAVLARRVFGIRLIIRRGLQHMLLSRSVLVAEGILVFLFLENLLRLVAGHAGGATGSAIITLAIIGGLGRINRPLFRSLDRRFFRERYVARRLLLGLGQRFAALAQKNLILGETTEVITRALQVQGTCCLGRSLQGGQPVWRVLTESPADCAESPLPAAALEDLAPERPLVDLPGEDSRAGEIGHPAFELLVAIPGADGIAGSLALAAKRSGEPFSQEDRTLLTTVAGQLGLALENLALLEIARREARHARELEIARQVQRQLFPAQLPELPGWGLAALCQPAQEVGGDYYDVFLTDTRQLALALGDVSGKGVGPALVMSNIQALIRDRLRRGDVELPALARMLNQHLLEFTGPSTFITLFVALLDPGTGRLCYVNCGHNPPLLLTRTSTEPQRLDAGGTILGLLSAQEFPAAEVTLDRGSMLVLYSDGVTEAEGPGNAQFEELRLLQVIREQGDDPAVALASTLAAIEAFADGRAQSDDISLICLRRL